MATQAQFEAAAAAAGSEAQASLDAATSATGDTRRALLEEADRLIARAARLNVLAADLAASRLAMIVGELQTMAREERERGSAITAAVDALLRSTRRQAGLPETPAPEVRAVPAPPAAPPAPGPASAPAAVPASDPAVPATVAVDVHARDTDLARLHPVVRERVERVLAELDAAGVPMRVFEAWRSPERQRHLFRQGRQDPGRIVTRADAWNSCHQYGLAVDLVIDAPGVDPWEDGTAQARQWWDTCHATARRHGLEPLSFEKPHLQLAGTSVRRLREGDFPDGGDARWLTMIRAAAARFPDGAPPLAGDDRERPALPVSDSMAGLPAAAVAGWTREGDGIEWRVDAHGVCLRQRPDTPLRTPGAPDTCAAILERFGDPIRAASLRHQVPPELIVMTIATEAGAFVDDGFTGPATFRWEARVTVQETGDPAIDGHDTGDYSAGPMQVLASTARWINRVRDLGHDAAESFPHFGRKPRAPANLGLYDPDIAIDVGSAYIAHQAGTTGLDPIRVAAAYNAGSLRRSTINLWGLHAHGNHLDRAARWYGDACDALRLLGR